MLAKKASWEWRNNTLWDIKAARESGNDQKVIARRHLPGIFTLLRKSNFTNNIDKTERSKKRARDTVDIKNNNKKLRRDMRHQEQQKRIVMLFPIYVSLKYCLWKPQNI